MNHDWKQAARRAQIKHGIVRGEPVVFDNAAEAITHAASGEWATLV